VSRNSLSADMIRELSSAIKDAGDDQSVRTVVLSAAPPVFSAGHDLRELAETSAHGCSQAIFDACAELMLSIRNLPVPVIASVSGKSRRFFFCSPIFAIVLR
jgi:enoyl-CoA hydratase/carnithine racemase